MIKVTCQICGDAFLVKPYKLEIGKGKFCSNTCYGIHRSRKPIEQRLKRIRKDPETGCWVWTGTTFSNGYGQVVVNKKQFYAHRLAWEVANNQSIPDGFHILHSCDNVLCVNPEHLRAGTHQDNMQDMIDRDRNAKGDNAPWSKLTASDVLAIRAEAATWAFARDWQAIVKLANQYGVHPQTIRHIIVRDTWKHL